jgi:hypothetical protein
MGTAVLPDRGATLRSRNGLVRRCGDALHKRGDELLEARLPDKRSRLARLDPLDRPLLELGPDLALPFDQQGVNVESSRKSTLRVCLRSGMGFRYRSR